MLDYCLAVPGSAPGIPKEVKVDEGTRNKIMACKEMVTSEVLNHWRTRRNANMKCFAAMEELAAVIDRLNSFSFHCCEEDSTDSALVHPGYSKPTGKDILLGCGTGVVRELVEQRVEDAIDEDDLIPHESLEIDIDLDGNRIRSLSPHIHRLHRLYTRTYGIDKEPTVSFRDFVHGFQLDLSPPSPRFSDLKTRLAPYFKQCIHDALEPLLGPVAAVVQSHGEEERKQREEFLGLEEKKLALRRKKIQRLKRHRAGRFQPCRGHLGHTRRGPKLG